MGFLKRGQLLDIVQKAVNDANPKMP
ncbi:hypothetical protein SAJ_2160, partial [Streptococcus agalactiae 18RS21]